MSWHDLFLVVFPRKSSIWDNFSAFFYSIVLYFIPPEAPASWLGVKWQLLPVPVSFKKESPLWRSGGGEKVP